MTKSALTQKWKDTKFNQNRSNRFLDKITIIRSDPEIIRKSNFLEHMTRPNGFQIIQIDVLQNSKIH